MKEYFYRNANGRLTFRAMKSVGISSMVSFDYRSSGGKWPKHHPTDLGSEIIGTASRLPGKGSR